MPKGRIPRPWFRKSAKQWYVVLGGRQIPLGPDKRKAMARYNQLMLDHDDERVKSVPMTVERIADLWLAAKESGKTKAATLAKYRQFGESFAAKYGAVKLSALKPHHVEEWMSGFDWNSSSQHLAVSCIKAMVLWGLKGGYYQIDPLKLLKRPEMGVREPISPEEADAVIAGLSPVFRSAIQVQFLTGVRPGEVCSMLIENTSLEKGTTVVSGKRGVRTAYLSAEAIELVRPLIAGRVRGPLFCDESGNPISVGRLQHNVLVVRRRLGLRDVITPHCYRALFATEAVRNGLEEPKVSKLLGHAKVQTTLKHYVSVDESMMRDWIEKANQRPPSPETDQRKPEDPPE